MRDLISFLAAGIIGGEEEISIDVMEGDATYLVTISGAQEPCEALRGEDDRILSALRAVLTARAGRRKVVLEIVSGGPTQ